MNLKTLKKLLREYSAVAVGQAPPGTKDNDEGTGNTGTWPGTQPGTHSGTVGGGTETTPPDPTTTDESQVIENDEDELVNEEEITEFSSAGGGAIQGAMGLPKIAQNRRKTAQKKRKNK